jgi:cyclopropane-fatty-acyl-phospholipid synthase
MLDRNLQYTCAFFQDTDDLDIAQEQKMRLIGQKLNLKRGQIVLDIGCGWGGLVNYLSSTFDVKVVGITLSKEQIKYARQRYGSNKNASFMFMDYRKIPKNMMFDRIVSVGMLEHVGDKNYDAYFKVVHDHLNQDGIALIHT